MGISVCLREGSPMVGYFSLFVSLPQYHILERFSPPKEFFFFLAPLWFNFYGYFFCSDTSHLKLARISSKSHFMRIVKKILKKKNEEEELKSVLGSSVVSKPCQLCRPTCLCVSTMSEVFNMTTNLHSSSVS
jgi:hypothetical protein